MKKFQKIDGGEVYLDLKMVTAVSEALVSRQVTIQSEGKDKSEIHKDVPAVEIRCGIGHYFVTGVNAVEVADMVTQAKR